MLLIHSSKDLIEILVMFQVCINFVSDVSDWSIFKYRAIKSRWTERNLMRSSVQVPFGFGTFFLAPEHPAA